ncbi:MAG: hypothetical protein R6U98_11535 [Pirellulaceae bacterium]
MVPLPQVGKTLAIGDVSRLPGVSYETDQRFQPRCPASLESCHCVGKFRLPVDVLLFPGGKLVLVEYALDVGVKQAVKSFLHLVELGFLICHDVGLLCILLALPCLHFGNHLVRPIIGNGDSPDALPEKFGECFFPNGLRGAWPATVAAVVVTVALLLRGRDHTAALVTADQTAQREWMFLRASASATPFAYILNALEQLASNEMRVLTLVDLATELEDSDIECVRKDGVDATHGERLSSDADQPPLLGHAADVCPAVVTCRVGLEHTSNDGCTLLVKDDGSGKRIVHVSRWRHVRIDAVTQLLTDAAADCC